MATANYLSLPLLRKMEKAPDVLAVIDKNWGKVDAGADSIFDDFHGSSGKAAANVKKEDELKKKLSNKIADELGDDSDDRINSLKSLLSR